jgi:UDPglucose--hexose-1-phosphate uridylyltransferase
VFENEEFVAFEPWAPRSPFETWIVPRRHESNFEAEPKERLTYAAQALRVTLAKLMTGLGRPAYNFMVHSNPLRDTASPSYHWHIEVVPALTQVAGFEWGSGFHINPVPPEEAADFLRKVAV